MTNELQQIIPRPGEIKPYKIPDEVWEELTERLYGTTEEPHNITFDHVQDWDTKFWSIQNIHNQAACLPIGVVMTSAPELKPTQKSSFGFWTFIGILFMLAAVSWLPTMLAQRLF
jgi:hypothetical protein